MKPTILPADLEAELTKFRLGGGVVGYFVFELNTETDPRKNATESSIHETAMRAVLHQLEQQAQPRHFPTALQKLVGQEVTSEQFLTAISNDHSPHDEIGVIDDEEPLFRLQRMPEETRASFDAINALLFNSFSNDLEIMRWSEGFLEWWGAFWWTVHNRTKGQVVVMTASATD